MTLATLREAIDWARDHWAEQRPAPLRLHIRENEGLGPFYSPAFAAALDGSPDAVTTAPTTVPCYHPLIRSGASPRDCPECIGLGVKDIRTDRYIYPMSRALTRLRCALGSPRQPHPYHVVLILAESGWDVRLAAERLNRAPELMEAPALQAIRRLHSHYSEGPVSTRTSAPTWIDKSDSQRAAETAA